jgi:hypothetical protein
MSYAIINALNRPTWQGECQSLRISVVESDVSQIDGHFGLLVFYVPLEGRHKVDTATNSVKNNKEVVIQV